MIGIDKESGIWSVEVAKKKHSFDPLLCGAIMVYYPASKIETVADLGCGPGYYCRLFKTQYTVVHGYDGTPFKPYETVYSRPWTSWKMYNMDLSQPQTFYEYDLVVSLEVGEHISRRREQIFIDNVVGYTKKCLVLSWAIPGQGGTSHVNELPNDYVIAEVEKRGLRYSYNATRFLRIHSYLPWFKHSIMAFKR